MRQILHKYMPNTKGLLVGSYVFDFPQNQMDISILDIANR
jgi:hypothetical protein